MAVRAQPSFPAIYRLHHLFLAQVWHMAFCFCTRLSAVEPCWDIPMDTYSNFKLGPELWIRKVPDISFKTVSMLSLGTRRPRVEGLVPKHVKLWAVSDKC